MLLAELEIRHSRPVAPTRRVALGLSVLPTDPLPGWGPVLLGGLLAAFTAELGADDHAVVFDLIDEFEAGKAVPQPQLRHRFQTDVVGLDRSRHSLLGEGEHVYFDFDDRGLAEVSVLGALYAASRLPRGTHPHVFRCLRKAMHWERTLDETFVAHLLGDDAAFSRWRALPTDARWALKLFGFGPDDHPDRAVILTRFRDLVWESHPDRGGDPGRAGQRMAELTHARRILIG